MEIKNNEIKNEIKNENTIKNETKNENSNKNETGVSGNSTNVDIDKDAAEIRTDVKVCEFDSVRLWGVVLNCKDEPVENALVKLVKISTKSKKEEYEGVAHTTTDCNGFYQFEVCKDEESTKFKIIVGKAVKGKEVINTTKGDCNPCEFNNCGCLNNGDDDNEDKDDNENNEDNENNVGNEDNNDKETENKDKTEKENKEEIETENKEEIEIGNKDEAGTENEEEVKTENKNDSSVNEESVQI